MSIPEYFESPLSEATLKRLVDAEFGDMVKFVVDLNLGVMAVGGEFHSDEEALLLEKGSKQSDLWGANYYPGRPEGKRVVYTSMINVRPGDGNTKQEVQSEALRKQIDHWVKLYLGTL